MAEEDRFDIDSIDQFGSATQVLYMQAESTELAVEHHRTT